MPEEPQGPVVIVDDAGQHHIFPPGFDPIRASKIVKGQITPAPTPPAQQAQARSWVDTAAELLPAAGATIATTVGRRAGPLVRPVLAGVGAAAGEGYKQIAQHATELPSAVADVARNLVTEPNATLHGFAQGAKEGLTETAKQAAIYAATEGAGEVIGAGARALPSATKAAGKFQQVMSAAKNVPVDVEAPGEVALRIQQLAERGGSMPKAVRDLLKRITDPSKPQPAYEEMRDFASNVSRLSANEMGRLTPVMQREVANLRVAVNAANAKAAEAVGQRGAYEAAMREYRQAMKLRDLYDSVLEGAKRSAPYATAAGSGYWLASKVRSLLKGE